MFQTSHTLTISRCLCHKDESSHWKNETLARQFCSRNVYESFWRICGQSVRAHNVYRSVFGPEGVIS